MQDYDSLAGDDDVPFRRRMMTICQRQILVEPMTMLGWRTRRHTVESLVQLNEVQYDSIKIEMEEGYETF